MPHLTPLPAPFLPFVRTACHPGPPRSPPPPPPRALQLGNTRPQIAILDFGSQYSHLIARRVREFNVYCELYSCLVEPEVLGAATVVGIILSGGPASVYDPESPHVNPKVWEMIEEKGIPGNARAARPTPAP